MSKTAVALKKAESDISDSRYPISDTKLLSGAYSELIRRLFYHRSAVAVVPSGVESGSAAVCEGIAFQLATTGKCVVIVSVDQLFKLKSFPPVETSACRLGKVGEVWLWPSLDDARIDFVLPSASSPPTLETTVGNWLDSLRRIFDAVILDCPGIANAPAVIEVAALADAVVLVVEAGRTRKQQVSRDQLVLQSSGVNVSGCILTAPR